MDVRRFSALMALLALCSLGADFATPHFVIKAPDAATAKRVGEEAERFRRELALEWLGYELPAWKQKCFIFAAPSQSVGPQGRTNYDVLPPHIGGGVTNFRMEIEGPYDRMLDSVLPHEITHTVLASHFGHPVPRWADEGASTTVEHGSETVRHEQLLRKYLTTQRGIPMNHLMLMEQYPREILTLYAQGYSVSRFLIEQRGRRQFVTFLEDYFLLGSWTDSVKRHYGYDSLTDLQDHWLRWVAAGNPSVAAFAKQSPQVLASVTQPLAGDITTVPDGSAIRPPPGIQTAIASSARNPGTEGGWYARQRQEMAAREQLPPPDASQPPGSQPPGSLPAGSLPAGAMTPGGTPTVTAGVPQPAPANWGPQQGSLWR